MDCPLQNACTCRNAGVCVALQLVGSPPGAYIIIGNALLPGLLCTCCNNSWWGGMHMRCSHTMCCA